MNRDRVRDLWFRYLAGESLSEGEDHELLTAFEQDPVLRQEILEDLRADGLLHVAGGPPKDADDFARAFFNRLAAQHDATRFIKKVESQLSDRATSVPESTPLAAHGIKAPTKRLVASTRRTLQRQSSEASSSWAVLGVAAAGILAVVTLFLVPSPAEKDLAATERAKEARVRASKEAEARKQVERHEREREQAQADAQKMRTQAEAQLREIEEKRRVLTQAKPEAGEDAQAKEKREKDLEALKRDQERIEQDLREAAALAKKTGPPAPAQPPQGEKPQSVPAAPGAPSQGTTQAPLAKVEEVAGDAFLVTKEGKAPATEGANVLPGQGLETGGGPSRIVLRFPDKTRLDLGPETLLTELKIDTGKLLTLTRGMVRAVVAKQPKGEPLIVTTPHGQAKVVGTTLRLVVDPDPKKGTRLEVEEGKVELKNLAGKTVMVESGHYAVAAVGVELMARVLPPRPGQAAFIFRYPKAAWGAVLQTVTLIPGQTYTLSVWIQTSTADPARSTEPFPGGLIGVRTESGAILTQQPFGPSEAYARTVLVFKAGPNPAAVIFAGLASATANSPDGTDWIHLDDWSLVQKGGDGTNLVQDADYEGQNPAAVLLSGPWFSEGPPPDGRGDLLMLIGVDHKQGRISVKETFRGERK